MSGHQTTTQWYLLHIQTCKRDYIFSWASGTSKFSCTSIHDSFLSYLCYKNTIEHHMVITIQSIKSKNFEIFNIKSLAYLSKVILLWIIIYNTIPLFFLFFSYHALNYSYSYTSLSQLMLFCSFILLLTNCIILCIFIMYLSLRVRSNK